MRTAGSPVGASSAPTLCASAPSGRGAALSKKPGCSIIPPRQCYLAPPCARPPGPALSPAQHSSIANIGCPQAGRAERLEPRGSAETHDLIDVVGFLEQRFGNIEPQRPKRRIPQDADAHGGSDRGGIRKTDAGIENRPRGRVDGERLAALRVEPFGAGGCAK